MIKIENSSQDSDEILMCGSYKKGTKLKATINRCQNLNDFTFRTHILNRSHFRMMRCTSNIRYPSGASMYSARPYTSDLGDIKILLNHMNQVHRCKIEDLYTVAIDGELVMKVDVLLIDRGTYAKNLDLESLYDFQQTIGFYKEIPPEHNQARIHLGESLPLTLEDIEINEYFVNTIKKRDKMEEYLIEILGYQDGVYHVDIFDKSGRSMISHIRKKFADQLKSYESLPQSIPTNEIYNVSSFFEPSGAAKNSQNTRNRYQTRQIIKPLGALQYFQKKLKEMPKDKNELYLQKRFFKVKVLCWSHPNSFFIIPDDNDYLSKHDQFRSDLKVIGERAKKKPDTKNKYQLGERCLFRNEIDPNLGPWLRGVIIDAPKNVTNGFLIDYEQLCGKNPFLLEEGDIIYLVESIDYGFQCCRTAENLLEVQDNRIFQKCPWALKCRLFGIEPHDNTDSDETDFSKNCLDMIDCWMRERILDDSRFAFFHLLFRSDIMSLSHIWSADNKLVDITLFHRFEPLYKLADCIGPRIRRTQYHCLNSYVIESGLASDTNQKTGKRSRVDLDYYVVNLLVQHDKI